MYLDDKVIVIGVGEYYIHEPQHKINIYLQEIDTCAVVNNYKTITSDINQFYLHNAKKIDDNLILGFGAITDTIYSEFNSDFAAVYFIDSTLDTIKTIRYTAGSADAFNNGIILNNGNIIAVGRGHNISGVTNTDALVVCFDSTGVELWHRYYGGTSIEMFTDIVEVAGGYIISGNKEDCPFLSLPTFYRDGLYLMKIDSLGNVLWSQCFSPINTLDNELHLLSDGNVMISYIYMYEPLDLLLTPMIEQYPSIAFRKINSATGALISEHVEPIDSLFAHEILNSRMLDDGGYITCGLVHQAINHLEKFGLLIRSDSLGHTIWQKAYLHYPDRYNWLWDVCPREGGGYWAVGSSYINDTTQSFWTIAVDENGDLLPACTDTSTIRVIELPLISSPILYPNITMDYISIESPEEQLSIAIYDAQGRLCHSQAYSKGERIATHTLSTGNYILHARADKRHYIAKFVKQ